MTAWEDASAGVPVASGDLVAVCDKYLPLVNHAVTSYVFRLPAHADVDELTGAAILGLVEAARRFDPARGVPFEAWALTRIRGAILDAARSADFASRSTRAKSRTVEAVTADLTQRLGRPPTDKELTAELGMSRSELDDLRAKVHRGLVVSLDGLAADADSSTGFAETLIDADMPPLEALERRELDAYVRDCVLSLPDKLRWIVMQYFYHGRTSAEIAEELNVSESRISQLRSDAIRLLRDALGSQYEEIAARTERLGAALSPRSREVASAAAARSTYAERLSSRQTTLL